MPAGSPAASLQRSASNFTVIEIAHRVNSPDYFQLISNLTISYFVRSKALINYLMPNSPAQCASLDYFII